MSGEDHYGVRVYTKRGNVGFTGPVVSTEMERLLGGGSAHLEEKQARTALLQVL